MSKRTYQTSGRQRLGKFFAENPDVQFSTEELCAAINGDAETGRSTVYRHLNELCRAEIIQKVHSTGRNCYVYQYVGAGCDCRTHFHGKCIRCGALEHLGCEDSLEFADHLLREHGFAVDCGQSILYGLCKTCRTLAKGEIVHA